MSPDPRTPHTAHRTTRKEDAPSTALTATVCLLELPLLLLYTHHAFPSAASGSA
jgi:hypothetical protein